MTFFEFCKDLIDSAKERIKSPIMSTFTIFFVIHNWRPIVLLLYSNKPIESTIQDINSEYFKCGSFLIPLLYATLYSVILPYLSVLYEKYLYDPNKKRRITSNNARIDIVENKILLADAELRLQDKLSRNQEKQELLDKIDSLEKQRDIDLKSAVAVNETFQSQISELTKQLNQANELLKSSKVLSNKQNRQLKYVSLIKNHNLTSENLRSLMEVPVTENVIINSYLNAKLKKFLLENAMVYEGENILLLTAKGVDFLKFLRDLLTEMPSLDNFIKGLSEDPGY